MLKEITKGVIEQDASPGDTFAVIIDAMALVQKSRPVDTFGEFAVQLLESAIRTAGNASRVDVVFDVYQNISIKNFERSRRSSDNILLKNITAGHKIKQWK